MKSLIRRFLYSAGVLLLLTAVAKFVSACGSAQVLELRDPIFGISFRMVFCVVGGIEILVTLVCLFGRRLLLQAGCVAWLASNFLMYRLGLLWIGYHKPCSCMGNLTDALHIRPEVADVGIKIILAYLLIGSCGSLVWLWRQNRKAPLPVPAKEDVPAAV